jgi:hypothetical protein
MFTVLILICSINLAPAECQPETAADVIRGPEAASEEMCGLHGQAYLAEIALGTRHRENEYVKIKCTRTTIAGGSVG